MNGRIFDPVLGRFLSADPNIDGVSDSQGYNRYSYVHNNPLNATDPSGYLSFKEVVKIVAVVVIAVVAAVYLGPLVGQALGSFLSSTGAVTTWTATTEAIIMGAGAGLAGGFASGFAGSLLNGGSIGDAFKAGVIGGVTGAITGGMAGYIGQSFEGTGNLWHELKRAASHGLVGGAVEEATGGEFRHGFFSSAAGSFAGHKLSGWLPNGDGPSDIFARTAFASAVGGTVSVIGGGKFANGAVTSAFQHLCNAELPREMTREAGAYKAEEGEAVRMLEASIKDLNLALSGDTSSIEAFEKWFGPFDEQRARVVLNNLSAIRDKFLDGSLVYRDVYPGSRHEIDAVAWVQRGVDPNRINLQRAFWEQSTVERAGTLVHEVSHLVARTKDIGIGHGRTLSNWAKFHPKFAVDNAYNYQNYVLYYE